MNKVSWITVLISCSLFCGCETEEFQKIVRVEFSNGEVVYSSGGTKSKKLRDLFRDERKPDTLEIMLTAKLTQAQILKIREEVSLLGVPTLRFSERATGLHAEMKGAEAISRSELDAEIRKRSK